MSQYITLLHIADLESWKRSAVDGTLKQFKILCDARNAYLASPDVVSLIGSINKLGVVANAQLSKQSQEDMEQLAAHKRWSEITTRLLETGPGPCNDGEVEEWLNSTRTFLDASLKAITLKERNMKIEIQKWIIKNTELV